LNEGDEAHGDGGKEVNKEGEKMEGNWSQQARNQKTERRDGE